MIRRIIITAAAAGAALFAPAVAHAAPTEDPDGGLERLIWFNQISPDGDFDPAALPPRPAQQPATGGTQSPSTPQQATPQNSQTRPATQRPAQRPAQSGQKNPLEMLTGLLNGRGIMG